MLGRPHTHARSRSLFVRPSVRPSVHACVRAQSLLNYRQLGSWDCLIADVLALAGRGVRGARLEQAQSWPLIMRADLPELYRKVAATRSRAGCSRVWKQ